MVPIKILGINTQALLDTGSITNLFSSRLCDLLALRPKKSGKSIKVADESMDPTCGTLNALPISFGEHSFEMDCIVVDDMPVQMIIGLPTLEKLEARIDMDHNGVTVNIEGREVQLSFE